MESAKKHGPTHNPLKGGGKRSIGGKFYGKKQTVKR